MDRARSHRHTDRRTDKVIVRKKNFYCFSVKKSPDMLTFMQTPFRRWLLAKLSNALLIFTDLFFTFCVVSVSKHFFTINHQLEKLILDIYTIATVLFIGRRHSGFPEVPM